MKLKTIALIFSSLLMSACVSSPTREPVQSQPALAHYGLVLKQNAFVFDAQNIHQNSSREVDSIHKEIYFDTQSSFVFHSQLLGQVSQIPFNAQHPTVYRVVKLTADLHNGLTELVSSKTPTYYILLQDMDGNIYKMNQAALGSNPEEHPIDFIEDTMGDFSIREYQDALAQKKNNAYDDHMIKYEFHPVNATSFGAAGTERAGEYLFLK